ncbi:hypothetical protein WICPIJ_000278 [Wickerhamomyces pijperi]|uniref:Protein LST4 n=1 Tax=Wickerhamomyces pijperi TaxID=599730 RepID=A0A9P8QH84_WICPI|nr:hypothetical protein WICPIJ_000278 [Wickerhamomyces pijperi]
MLGRLLNRGLSSLDVSSSPSKEERKPERRGSFSPQNMSYSQPKVTLPSPIPMGKSTIGYEPTPDAPAVVNNEDSYSRTILYGTPNHFQNDTLLPQHFRMVVVLEKSDFLQKNNHHLLYNSSRDAYPNYQNYHGQYPSRNSTTAPTPIPPTSTGSGSHEIRHPLSQLNELMFGNGLYSNDLNLSDTVKLHVLPSLPLLRSSVLITKTFYVKIDKRESRVCIGLVMPISVDHFSSVLFPNWASIKFFLTYMKDTFLENHYNKQLVSITNTGNFSDMSRAFKSLIKSLNNLNNIPRLLPGLNKFDSMLYNWCFEVNNWIEMKDGGKLSFNNGSKFLSALLTSISVVKNQLVGNELARKSQCTRVVVVASNPGVAQKLIFLISELLPFELEYVVEAPDSDSTTRTSTTATTTTTTTYNQYPETHHPLHFNSNSDSTLVSADISKDTVASTTPSFTKKGWEIPVSSAKSINTTSIEMVHSSSVRSSSLSTSNSMAYLSSSLSNSHSSMIPSSLTRGFQLLQNWKSSLDSPSSSVSPTPFSSQSFPSPSNQEYEEYPWTPATTSNPTPVVSSINPNSLNTANFNDRHARTTSVHCHPHRPSLSSIPINNSYHDLSSMNNSTKIKKVNIPKLPHIDRNSSTLYGIGETSSLNGFGLNRKERYNMLKAECKALMNSAKVQSTIETDENGVTFMDIPYNDDDEDDDDVEDLGMIQTTGFTTLPLTCSYLNEYAPEFQLQACPPQADLESRILNSMKMDVTYGEYTSCKSILISLRSREIKELKLEKISDGAHCGEVNNVTNKKLYGNSKINWSLTPRETFNRVDSLIEEILVTFQREQVVHKGVDLEDLQDEVRFEPFIKFRELLMSL